MPRRIIHPDHPYTEEEHAAALVLLGHSAADAVAKTVLLKQDLAEEVEPEIDEQGGYWSWLSPRVIFSPEFPPVIQVVSHIISDGAVLSVIARDAWLDDWKLLISSDEADARLDELVRLGKHLTRYRVVLHRLLTTGRL